MNIVQIEEVVKNLVSSTVADDFAGVGFIYEFLLAYGHRQQSVTRLKSGERNLARDEVNTVLWKRHLYFKIEKSAELHGVIDAMRKEKWVARHKIRFVIATDFKTFLAIDTKTGDTLDIEFKDLANKFDFFLPWAGMEKAVYQGENPADVKAAEKLARLFDEIKADNFDTNTTNDPVKLHELNVFLSRLLFCFFAEDTEIFKDNQFSGAIGSHTKEDGSDLADYLKRLFTLLNQPELERPGLPDYLANFPYVNGGLFKDDIPIPIFNRKSRKILIECGSELDWSDINPDIFGSMFQAVVHTEQRSNMGQHYTSVPNIMKVIEPLFLNDLYEEIDKAQDSQKKLLGLQERIGKIKIFDPACGSGNFLIIAYKELRKLEMEILKRVQELEYERSGQMFKPFSVIQLSQFYGIEIDDFAHEVAILSLWLTEHQMNMAFKDEFGESLPSLPLRNGGRIVSGNSVELDWGNICTLTNLDEAFVLGNPPYKGFSQQSSEQKRDLKIVIGSTTKLDYISCWFIKGAEFVSGSNASLGFVSTNSITQGEQVALLWNQLRRFNVGIHFAHQAFKWTNSAKANAGVTCVIVGLIANEALPKNRKIYQTSRIVSTQHISPYLTSANVPSIEKRRKVLSKLPKMVLGSMPNDWGHLYFSTEEKESLLVKYPSLKSFIKKVVGSNEFIKGLDRWCLWIDEENLHNLAEVKEIQERLELVFQERSKSKKKSYQQFADRPYRFIEIRHQKGSSLIIPGTSSERRKYIPIGFLDDQTIINNLAFAIYNPEPFLFSVLTSKVHNLWIRAVGGALETRLRYSNVLCYNTFPFPEINSNQKERLFQSAFKILSVREGFSHLPMSKLYNPDTMPDELKLAHEENDQLVESCYRKKPFESDEDRLEHLFNLYEKMIKEEKANA